jgi:hydroxymethylglutaryl-CoA lyase
MSVSETHNQANMRMTREQSFAQLAEIVAAMRDTGVALNLSLSTVFGCPMEGDIALQDVHALVDRFSQLGVAGITLCDTTGMAYPSQVNQVAKHMKAHFGHLEFTMHFHNTRGMALANTLEAIDAGIDRFDASLGGIGGCPYAPGASVVSYKFVELLFVPIREDEMLFKKPLRFT